MTPFTNRFHFLPQLVQYRSNPPEGATLAESTPARSRRPATPRPKIRLSLVGLCRKASLRGTLSPALMEPPHHHYIPSTPSNPILQLSITHNLFTSMEFTLSACRHPPLSPPTHTHTPPLFHSPTLAPNSLL